MFLWSRSNGCVFKSRQALVFTAPFRVPAMYLLLRRFLSSEWPTDGGRRSAAIRQTRLGKKRLVCQGVGWGITTNHCPKSSVRKWWKWNEELRLRRSCRTAVSQDWPGGPDLVEVKWHAFRGWADGRRSVAGTSLTCRKSRVPSLASLVKKVLRWKAIWLNAVSWSGQALLVSSNLWSDSVQDKLIVWHKG